MNSYIVLFTTVMSAILLSSSAYAQSNPLDLQEVPIRFATMIDTTVHGDYIEAVVGHECNIMDSMTAATDPEQKCHIEALRLCAELGDDCGGYVIEPASVTIAPEDSTADVAYDDSATGIAVKILKKGAAEDVKHLIAVDGAVLFEKRDVVIDNELLALLEKEYAISKLIDQAIDKNLDIQEIEEEIERRVQQVNFPGRKQQGRSKRYASKTNRELAIIAAEMKASTVEEMVETVLDFVPLEKNGFPEKRVPYVSCTPGSFSGGKVSYAKITPGALPKYTPKKCTFSQFTPKLCACIAPVYIPPSCTGGLFLPGRPHTYLPPRHIPAVYEPPFCDIEYVEVKLHPKHNDFVHDLTP